MGTNPLVSVIVPVYNVEDYLDRCMDSIVNQTYTNFEVLLVDDGSTDSSGDLCDRWGKRDPRIRVFHKQNGGLSDARNYALDRMRGDYITCIDSDDYVETVYIESLLDALSKSDRYEMVGCLHDIVFENEKTTYEYVKPIVNEFSLHDALESALYNQEVDVSAWGKLYKSKLFSSLRYPKNHLYEDTYVFGDLLAESQGYLLLNSTLYHYVKRSDSIVGGGWNRSRLQYLDSAERLTACAERLFPSLQIACIRKRTQALLSVLRYMSGSNFQDKALRISLRNKALDNSSTVLKDANAPSRDKFALVALRFGYRTFQLSWKLYNIARYAFR